MNIIFRSWLCGMVLMGLSMGVSAEPTEVPAGKKWFTTRKMDAIMLMPDATVDMYKASEPKLKESGSLPVFPNFEGVPDLSGGLFPGGLGVPKSQSEESLEDDHPLTYNFMLTSPDKGSLWNFAISKDSLDHPVKIKEDAITNFDKIVDGYPAHKTNPLLGYDRNDNKDIHVFYVIKTPLEYYRLEFAFAKTSGPHGPVLEPDELNFMNDVLGSLNIYPTREELIEAGLVEPDEE